ncbi:dual specificity protein phosphatase family protein [Magnetospirillum sp. 15-1]|uniref:tyrosine phosphatase family protein n=1 Tax=Magnetospirillum sp. 15-1 TaxID=1979370 RepID=UPI000BBBA3D2|nr:dual specificity protein phosphatase family protein [Magnetospirillum sp. 15-1]
MTKKKLPFTMLICGLDELGDELESFRPSHILSILDPNEDRDDPLIFPESIKVLSLRFFDLHATTGSVGMMLSAQDRSEFPSIDHARDIIEFGREIPAGAKVLIHCWAGISRSTAAAFVLASLHVPPNEAMKLVMSLRPGAMPNRLIVKFADRILRAEGRMVGAIDGHKRDVDSRSIRAKRR